MAISSALCRFLTDILSEFEENPGKINQTSKGFLESLKADFDIKGDQIYISIKMFNWLKSIGNIYGLNFDKEYKE